MFDFLHQSSDSEGSFNRPLSSTLADAIEWGGSANTVISDTSPGIHSTPLPFTPLERV
jgi:hypothetical protein